MNDRVKFSDLTGDGRADAVVMIASGGAAGNVAVYVFSTEGLAADADLRAVYRGEGLYRGGDRPVDGPARDPHAEVRRRLGPVLPGEDPRAPPALEQELEALQGDLEQRGRPAEDRLDHFASNDGSHGSVAPMRLTIALLAFVTALPSFAGGPTRARAASKPMTIRTARPICAQANRDAGPFGTKADKAIRQNNFGLAAGYLEKGARIRSPCELSIA